MGSPTDVVHPVGRAVEKPIDFWLRKGKAGGEPEPTEKKVALPLHTDCRTRVPLYIGDIPLPIQVNAAFLFYDYLQNSRQLDATYHSDNQHVAKSYKNTFARLH